MSSTTTGGIGGRQPPGGQAQVGIEYIPTEEERRVFRECNQESFWYRSVPYSVVSMAVTQALVARGTLSASPRFGSLPKVVFAGFFGYMAGKLSYMKTCQEKFKRLENSPLGEALRQRTGLPSQRTSGAQSDLSDPDPQSFGPMFQPAEAGQKSYFTDAPVQMGRSEDFGAPGNYQAEPYAEEEEPRRKGILYEDLRLKNRENYEVMLSQKAETLHKTPPEKETRRPNKEVKNIYGDTWEE
ncbi:OCIA domain-containing protein 1 [Takifugu rubripes]|uniref:OCIA domain-containing protein 1 n=1 Tax=Takifugu flavidus TaxID=433684 RepID=A0A5C6MY18_9TELE|nr:OCIA domain-containing protein 1 [Takifugu rubripes]XP_056891268.1 OCIA domain-containing protein 1-like [Takifugu flavidus]TWW59853.1 OCIA domain-containing protein 1 [Takifugu flavidus]|eukprot:XP_011618926.1 PREDICTED: OCIA domain-containing protein 1 [Takifugu rubripes]